MTYKHTIIMKKYKNIYLVLTFLISGSMCFTSCEDTLKEDPDSYYTRKDFFTSVSNAEMAINGIYNILLTLYGDNDGQCTIASDDIIYPAGGAGKDNTRRDMGHYMLTTSNKLIESLWNGKYEQLNRANYCIQNIEDMKGYSQNNDLQRLVATAKFFRAQAAFDLVRYWGDVPFKTYYSSSYEDAYQPRTPREKIYEQIIEDLNIAKTILPWADAGTSPEKVSQGVVRALLMRVLLTRAGYSLQMGGSLERPEDDIRKTYFDAVIDEWEAFQKNGYHGFYDGGYEALFKSFSKGILNSKESLFEIAFYYPGAKGTWGTYMGPAVTAPNVSTGDAGKYMGRANATFRAVPEWKSFYETKTEIVEENGKKVEKETLVDKRRDVAICTYQYIWDDKTMSHIQKEDNSGRNWYPGKWRREWMPAGSTKDLNSTDINYCLFRYADVVLMAAEAYNEIGETSQAWILLNKIRERAGATQVHTLAEYRQVQPNLYDLPYFNDGDEKDEFRTALYWERGLELAFEGQRKYDLIRWGILAEALQLFSRNTVANSDNSEIYIAADNFRTGQHELFPIPIDEIQVNYKLNGKNNPGY